MDEEQDQDQEYDEDAEGDESYEDDWWNNEADVQEEPQEQESMVKTILSQMKNMRIKRKVN